MDGYKLIVSEKNDRYKFKLFNLIEDPKELQNIAGENQSIVGKMVKKIQDLKKDCQVRLKHNLSKIDKGVNIKNKHEELEQQLKNLGYL